jgi:nucleoside-diphosphate-sugar epimerase
MIRCGITGFRGNLGKTFLKTKKFHFVRFSGDISRKVDVIKWINKNEFDIIVHFAAIVPTYIVNKNYQRALKVNYIGTKYLIDAILKYKKNIKWFFFASTSHVYPSQKKSISEKNETKPLSKYGKTKLKAENYIIKKFKNEKLNFCVGRIFSIFDNKGRGFFTPSLLGKVRKGNKDLILENLNHYRDFLTTEQISKIIIFLWRQKFRGIINIGSGKKTNLQKIANIFAKKVGKKIFIKNNKPSFHVANISKLKRMGYKSKKLNIERFF